MNRRAWGFAAAAGWCCAFAASVGLACWSLAGPVIPAHAGLPIVAAAAFLAGFGSVPAVVYVDRWLTRRNTADLGDLLSGGRR